MQDEEVTVFIRNGKYIVPLLRKFRKYKDYPKDLYEREFIIALRMTKGSFHQIWDNEKKWLNYTW